MQVHNTEGNVPQSLTFHFVTPHRTPVDMQKNSVSPRDETKPEKNSAAESPDMYPGFESLLVRADDPNAPLCAKREKQTGVREKVSLAMSKPQTKEVTDGHIKANTQKRQTGVETPKSKRRRRSSSCSTSDGRLNDEKNTHTNNIVHHEYHDYSGLSGGPVLLPPLPKKGKGGVTSMFPTVLHYMLGDAEKLGFQDVISWQPHGRCFMVHQPKTFADSVMPKYFRHTRLSSFQRQLSLYGFLRLARKGPDHGAYYHECFLRGMMHLCNNMQRKRVKGTMVRQSSNPNTEPDFYNMPPLGDGRAHTGTATPTAAGASYNGAAASTAGIPPLALRDNLTTESSDEQAALLDFALQKGGFLSHHLMATPSNPCDSKYLRHLQTRLTNPLRSSEDQAHQQESSEVAPPLERQVKPEGDSISSSSSHNNHGERKQKHQKKTNAELAVFLKEVDLDSSEDEGTREEEAMERILEDENEDAFKD